MNEPVGIKNNMIVTSIVALVYALIFYAFGESFLSSMLNGLFFGTGWFLGTLWSDKVKRIKDDKKRNKYQKTTLAISVLTIIAIILYMI